MLIGPGRELILWKERSPDENDAELYSRIVELLYSGGNQNG